MFPSLCHRCCLSISPCSTSTADALPLSSLLFNRLSTLQHACADAVQGTCAALTRYKVLLLIGASLSFYSSALPFPSTHLRFPFPLLICASLSLCSSALPFPSTHLRFPFLLLICASLSLCSSALPFPSTHLRFPFPLLICASLSLYSSALPFPSAHPRFPFLLLICASLSFYLISPTVIDSTRASLLRSKYVSLFLNTPLAHFDRASPHTIIMLSPST